jgi:hypothetical protein
MRFMLASLFSCPTVVWLTGMDQNTKNLIITGGSVLCWAIWISRNDLVFNKVLSTYVDLYAGAIQMN